jgi:hypothetical protein
MRKTALALILGTCLLAPLAICYSQQIDHFRIPGTKVSLVVPEGFSVAEDFPGLVKKEAVSSIMVTEIAGPFSKIRDVLTKENLATRGMTLLNSEQVAVEDVEGIFADVTQIHSSGSTFRKWWLVFGNESATVMVVATTPIALEAELGEAFERCLRTVKWDLAAKVDLHEGLPFRISETESLGVVDRISNTLVLTKRGHEGPVPPSDPMFVVGSSFSDLAISDLKTFARQRVVQTAQVTEIEKIVGQGMVVDKLKAYEIVADAKDLKTGVPIKVYQVVVLNGERYYLMQGFVGRANWKTYESEFRQIVRSFRRVD